MTRERRLWAWTAFVVLTIYATMGLARSLSDELRTRALFDNLFAVAMVLVAGSAVSFGWRRRASAAQWGVGFGVAAVYLLIFVRMGIPRNARTSSSTGSSPSSSTKRCERAGQGGQARSPS